MDSAKDDDGHFGYELRENPKKSWKFTSVKSNASAFVSIQESQCKVCGKDFGSLKALYGHMRHHSRRERKLIQCKQCGKAVLTANSLSKHMTVHSHKLRDCNELESVKGLVVKRKRSERKRYNCNAGSSISSLNESLSVTEFDQDIEQAATCLMLLSRGVQDLGELYAFNEFSDNDSVFECKLNKNKRVVKNGTCCSVSNGDELMMKEGRPEKLDSFVLYEKKEEDECKEVRSAAARDEEKKVKLEVSIVKLYEHGEYEMSKLDVKPGSVSVDCEMEKESSEDLMEEDGSNEESGKGIMTSTSSMNDSFTACDAEVGGDSIRKAKCSVADCGVSDNSHKKSEIKCNICSKIFGSRRALGGHKKMHSFKRSSTALKTPMWSQTEPDSKLVKLECRENLMEGENKEHKCRICLKVFGTGQALGGHQRAHHVKNCNNMLQEIAVEQDYCDVSNDLDIGVSNLLDEETDDGSGSEPWFLESEQRKHEPLVSVVAN